MCRILPNGQYTATKRTGPRRQIKIVSSRSLVETRPVPFIGPRGFPSMHSLRHPLVLLSSKGSLTYKLNGEIQTYLNDCPHRRTLARHSSLSDTGSFRHSILTVAEVLSRGFVCGRYSRGLHARGSGVHVLTRLGTPLTLTIENLRNHVNTPTTVSLSELVRRLENLILLIPYFWVSRFLRLVM